MLLYQERHPENQKVWEEQLNYIYLDKEIYELIETICNRLNYYVMEYIKNVFALSPKFNNPLIYLSNQIRRIGVFYLRNSNGS